ncbi:MAG: calcium-binding protein [Paracoccaceae bacterium]
MEFFVLLGLMGVMAMFGPTSNSEAAEPEPEEVDPPPTPGTQFIGTGDDDSLTGAASGEDFSGLDGDDTLDGSGGNDSLAGGEGEDLLIGGSGADLYYGGAGDDDVREDWYALTNPDDSDSGNDTAYGGAGADYLRGLDGDDSLLGGDGDDTIWGEEGDDVLVGSEGRDELFGGEGQDDLDGGLGNDLLTGGGGLDTLSGGEGNDTLSTLHSTWDDDEVGTSFLDGGEGNDMLSFDGGSVVSGGAGNDRFFMEDRLSDNLVSRIEDFDPDEDSLQIVLSADRGTGGGFALLPRADGLGQDLYIGNDLVAEILGSKPVTLEDMTITVLLEGAADAETTYFVGPDDASYDITVIGSEQDDRIIGNNGADQLRGGGGFDRLEGGAGNDTLRGSGGTIEYFGDSDTSIDVEVRVETDTLLGGEGDDDLWSTNGNVLTGGEGSDVFAIRNNIAGDDTDGVFPPSIVTDFDPAQDVMVMGPVDGIFPDASDIMVRVLSNGTGCEILVRGIVVAEVIGGQSLTAADIRIESIDGDTDYRAA